MLFLLFGCLSSLLTEGDKLLTNPQDIDEDGYSESDGDCNDYDATLNPETTWYMDADGDGFGNPDVWIIQCEAQDLYIQANLYLPLENQDFDDLNVEINPEAIEICDQIDNNCNGQTDEELLIIVYRDEDSDGFGDPLESIEVCQLSSGYVENNLDCDDSNTMLLDNSNDNDCDGVITSEDCDDNDPESSSISSDSDCDGLICNFGIVCDEITNLGDGIGIDWSLIPAGIFVMGSPTSEVGRSSDENQHTVTLSHDFYVSTTEVSQGMHNQLMGYQSYDEENTSDSNGSYGVGVNYPAYFVSWNMAAAFSNTLTQFHNEENETSLNDCYQCTGSGISVYCSTDVDPI